MFCASDQGSNKYTLEQRICGKYRITVAYAHLFFVSVLREEQVKYLSIQPDSGQQTKMGDTKKEMLLWKELRARSTYIKKHMLLVLTLALLL